MGSYDGKGGSRKGGNTQRGQAANFDGSTALLNALKKRAA
jgi:hypothetical protein